MLKSTKYDQLEFGNYIRTSVEHQGVANNSKETIYRIEFQSPSTFYDGLHSKLSRILGLPCTFFRPHKDDTNNTYILDFSLQPKFNGTFLTNDLKELMNRFTEDCRDNSKSDPSLLFTIEDRQREVLANIHLHCEMSAVEKSKKIRLQHILFIRNFFNLVENEYNAVIQKEKDDLRTEKKQYQEEHLNDKKHALKSLKKTCGFMMFFLKICYAIRTFLFKDFETKYNEMKKAIEQISQEYYENEGLMNYRGDGGEGRFHQIGEDIIESGLNNIYNHLNDPKNTRQKNFFLTKLAKEIEKKEKSRPCEDIE